MTNIFQDGDSLADANRQLALLIAGNAVALSEEVRRCDPLKGCGREISVSAFAHTMNALNASTVCLYCVNRRMQEYRQQELAIRVAARKRRGRPREDMSTRSPQEARSPEKSLQNWGHQMKYRHGITTDEYWRIYLLQQGRCAVCWAPGGNPEYAPNTERLSVDHSHDLLVVRGLLCRRCNTMLGNFADNISAIERACSYVEESSSARPSHFPGSLDNCNACVAFGSLYQLIGKAPSDQLKNWQKGLRRNYQLSAVEYLHILATQQSTCAICGKHEKDARPSGPSVVIPELAQAGLTRTLVVDHDHFNESTRPVHIRGLLCRECNWGLGRAKDSPIVLDGAAAYLRSPTVQLPHIDQYL